MTLARRVAALEGALTPTQLVLRWLAEAHSHDSLSAYVDAILDDAPEDFPINRLCREAAAGTRPASGRKVREDDDARVRAALRQTIFRYELVMRINVRTHELIDRDFLVNAVLCGQLAMLSPVPSGERPGEPAQRDQIGEVAELTLRQVIELHAAQEARALAESRYLDGQCALFPDARRAWLGRIYETERLAVMADRLAELDGAPRADLDDAEAVAGRVPLVLADLVEPAKVTTLEKLGDSERAFRIATSWLTANRRSLVVPV